MIRIIRRAWRYVEAMLEGKLDQMADPRVQIEQAIDEAKRQHALLTEQAAAVIGNERELDIRLGRTLDEIERLRESIAQTIRLEETARAEGDIQRANRFASAAEALAGRLIGIEANASELSGLRSKAVVASASARKAVEQNAHLLRQKLTERSRLLTQLEAVKMQERLTAALGSVSELLPAGAVPSLDEVRDKLDRRYANAMGHAALSDIAVEARLIDVEASVREAEASRRVTEIRRSLQAEGN